MLKFKWCFVVLFMPGAGNRLKWEKSRHIIKIRRFICASAFVALRIFDEYKDTKWTDSVNSEIQCQMFKICSRQIKSIKQLSLSLMSSGAKMYQTYRNTHNKYASKRATSLFWLDSSSQYDDTKTTSIFWHQFMLDKVLPCISCGFKWENMNTNTHRIALTA